MISRNNVILGAALLWTLAFFLFAIGYSLLTISVNSGRISEYTYLDDQIRKKQSEVDKDSKNALLQQDLANLKGDQASIQGQIEYGDDKYYYLTFSQCIVPLNPQCFHRNSSENNNIWLAMASGILGTCLFLLRGFVSKVTLDKLTPDYVRSFSLSTIFIIPAGMITGLIMLYLIRGAKGALVSPITEVVSVENPYGIAFVCAVAGIFSDRAPDWLLKRLPFKLGSNG